MSGALEQLAEGRAAAILRAGVGEFSRCGYADANTERIAAACGISKGLLFHYFGTKKGLYLQSLRHCLETLTQADTQTTQGDFYGILFASMEWKISLCAAHPEETRLLNMASRESSAEVRAEKDGLIAEYAAGVRAASEKVMTAAVSTLALKETGGSIAARGLSIYTRALINRYLLIYQETPEEFFARKETIKEELRTYIDLMLYGVCKEEG